MRYRKYSKRLKILAVFYLPTVRGSPTANRTNYTSCTNRPAALVMLGYEQSPHLIFSISNYILLHFQSF